MTNQMPNRIKYLRVGPSEDNVKFFNFSKVKNPRFSFKKFDNWPDTFKIDLVGEGLIKIQRTDLVGGWGADLVVIVEFELEFFSKEEIENWIVNIGGVCPMGDNQFGGNPSAKPLLNLKIQQRPSELAELVHFFLERVKNGENINYYAEIGACSGGTTRTMNEFLLFKEILIIDDGGEQIEDMYVRGRDDQLRGVNLGFTPRVEIIGSSAEERVIKHALNISKIHQYDILFIDGDHSYEGVRKDTINYLPILREGGYLVFHDTQHIGGVMNWMNEIESECPGVKRIKKIACKDDFTEILPDGLGITIFQKA